MSKYDFEIDLSLDTSTGILLSKLKPNSVVLEFGCATGRMTRYMKEALHCQVYIVEYDKGAFQKAKEFAQDGICDDIQNYRWVECFGEIAFDAIIFADVLEHLQNPEEVLEKAARLLKEDGSMLVTVPNVTHNDVVLKAIEEHVDYTETGLLDNTHIHFWGLENLRTLGEKAGLTVRRLEGTHCSVGSTEQNVQIGKNRLLENILRERSAGEIYQFVITMDKQDGAESICTIGAPTIYSHIYLDTGSDFNVQERIAVNAVYSGDGSYTVHYELVVEESICKVRFDPVEYQGVILRRISICQNGKARKLNIPNSIDVNAGIYIHSDDPMVIAQMQPRAGVITVDAEFLLPGVQYLDALEEAVWTEHQQVQNLQERLKKLNQEIADIEANEKQMLQIAQLQEDVRAYIMLVNQKEKQVLKLEQQNLMVVKLQRWIVLVLHKCKRIIKKLLKRG